MSGYEEVIAAWDAWEAAAAAIAAEEAAAAAGGAGAAAAAGSGLTAADYAALYGASEGAGAGAAGGSGLTAADYAALAGSNSASGYGAGATVSDSLLGPAVSDASAYGAGNTVTDSITAQPGQGPGILDELRYKGLNALNKVGGAYNRLPGPVQGLLASQAIQGMGGGQAAMQPMPARNPGGSGPPPGPSTQVYGAQQPYQAHGFSSYGTEGGMTQGLLGLTPEQIAMLKKLLAQQGGRYA